MNEYEITYLSETHLGEEDRTDLDNSIDSEINNLGGSVNHSTPSLRIKLAYPINKKTASFSRTIHIQLEPDKIVSFNNFLKKNKDIMRFRTITTPYRPGIKPEEVKDTENVLKAKQKSKTPATKEVTMEAVEKGIEEALEKEIK